MKKQHNMSIAQQLVRTIRETLGVMFCFVPRTKSLSMLYQSTISDYLLRKDDPSFPHLLFDELVEKKVLAEDPITHLTYHLVGSNGKDYLFHDISLRNYDNRSFSHGYSFSLEEAYAKALGEVFERIPSEYPDSDTHTILVKSVREMKKSSLRFVDPFLFPQPTQEQKEMFKELFFYNEDTPFSFLLCHPICDEPIYIPLQAIYRGFFGTESSPEPHIGNHTTNGLGAGYTIKSASESALFEVFERDRFLRCWYGDEMPDRVHPDTLPEGSDIQQLLTLLIEDGFSVSLFDLTEEGGIPVAIVALSRENSGIFMGGGAGYTLEDALYKALRESFSIYMWVYKATTQGGYLISELFCKVVTNDFLDTRLGDKERVFLWGTKEYASSYMKKLNFFSGKERGFIYKKFDKGDLFSYMKTVLGEGYLIPYRHTLLSDYDYYAVKAFFPEAYQLELVEYLSKPMKKDGGYPQNRVPHPFP